ncbi:MAG TPA: sulfotransferase, partial [Steroidobacteraceae bacterium]
FHCGGEAVHMAQGEAWIFDNWRRHRVENRSAQERIHLVADTSGTAAFWQFACGPAVPRERWRTPAWQPEHDAQPMTETIQHSPVMPAAEVELLLRDLCSELTSPTDTAEMRERAARFAALLESFVQDWRQLCALHGTSGPGQPEFRRLAGAVHNAAKPLAEGLVMRTNGVGALHVLEARVLKHLVLDDAAPHVTTRKDRRLEKPVFIVSAPRSGSTLLFETLACSPAFNTFGGEAHWLVEDVEALRPGAPGVDSNRLTAAQATPAVTATIRQAAVARLQGAEGRAPTEAAPLLEKTPKNSLRIPFLRQVFPDARFIFLWRDPRENLSSIIEAWRSGGWITYPSLPGWDGPWSLLLPPDWQSLRGAPLASIAARQWLKANETALEDLQQLPREQWAAVSYHGLLADPAATVRRLCEFAGVPFDQTLEQRTAGALSPSRSAHTPPAPDKWRRNEADIERVLPDLESCWQRLSALG